MSVYDFAYTSIENRPVPMSEYRGKVLLIVNTASNCGFTPQYKGLEALYENYRDRGFEVIGFPCNQFMGQEPGSMDEILEYCSTTWGVTLLGALRRHVPAVEEGRRARRERDTAVQIPDRGKGLRGARPRREGEDDGIDAEGEVRQGLFRPRDQVEFHEIPD